MVASGTGTATDSGWTQIIADQSSGWPVPARISYFVLRTVSSFASQGNAPTIGVDDLSLDHAGAPLSADGAPISATAETPFSGPVATVTDGDPTAGAGDFSASINWGDGTTSFGTIAARPGSGTFTVSGSHAWGVGGSFPVHVSISKVNGRSTAADTTAAVSGGGGGSGNPTASGAVVTPKPLAGGLVTLSGAASTPGRGRIVSYDWGFDNTSTTTSTGSNPIAHFIFKPGLHSVTLKVTNSGGQQSMTISASRSASNRWRSSPMAARARASRRMTTEPSTSSPSASRRWPAAAM